MHIPFKLFLSKLIKDKSLTDVENRLWKIRASLPGFEWMNAEERAKMKRKMNAGDMSRMVENKEDDIDDLPDREYDEDEVAELMQQR